MKKIYNLEKSRETGMFSEIFNFINQANKCDQLQYDGITVKRFSNIYYCDKQNKINSFYQYFFDKTDNSIIIPNNNYEILDIPKRIKNIDSSELYFNNDLRLIVNRVILKYLHLNNDINILIENFYNEKIKNKNILGIQIRRTDHYHHGKIIDINRFYEIIETNYKLYDGFFIISDDENVIKFIKNKYNKVITLPNIIRSCDTTAVHHMYGVDNFKKGLDVIMETYLLSKCNKIIATNSNISLFAICLNNEIEFTLIDIE